MIGHVLKKVVFFLQCLQLLVWICKREVKPFMVSTSSGAQESLVEP
ncbi:MAG: hypothetical protein RIR39_1568 [Pseudomonadota bacterium]